MDLKHSLFIIFYMAGAVSCTFVLKMSTSKKVTVVPGEDVLILCKALHVDITYCRFEIPGFPAALNLSPRSKADREYQYYGLDLDSGDCGIRLNKVSDKMSGVVKCFAGTNRYSVEAFDTMELIVARIPETPTMSLTPPTNWTTKSYREGDTITAKCEVKRGRPSPSISWFLGDEQVHDGLQTPIKDDEHVVQNATRTLTWADHGKKLKCLAEHMAYDDSSQQYAESNLSVTFAPREIPLPIKLYNFSLNKTGEILVEVSANPKPQFTWFIGNMSIKDGDKGKSNDKYIATCTEIKKTPGRWLANLTVLSMDSEDIEREYLLNATNEEGGTTYRVYLSSSFSEYALIGSIFGFVVALMILILIVVLIVSKINSVCCSSEKEEEDAPYSSEVLCTENVQERLADDDDRSQVKIKFENIKFVDTKGVQ